MLSRRFLKCVLLNVVCNAEQRCRYLHTQTFYSQTLAAIHETMKSIKAYSFLLLIFIQCQRNDDKAIETKVVQHDWKHGEGANIGD